MPNLVSDFREAARRAWHSGKRLGSQKVVSQSIEINRNRFGSSEESVQESTMVDWGHNFLNGNQKSQIFAVFFLSINEVNKREFD